VKEKVSEVFISLNLTLHSFGPENFVPLVKIGKFQKNLIEKTKSYKMVYYTWPTCNSCWEKVVLDKNRTKLCTNPIYPTLQASTRTAGISDDLFCQCRTKQLPINQKEKPTIQITLSIS
jgi:hypothetical protein